MALINWQIPSFEQSNPLLMGFRQGIGNVQGLQDIYRQGIENKNLPEKLREALLAQQLANQTSQVNLDFLPREKQASLQHQLDVNRFYPQMQQSNLRGNELSHQMTQMQIGALKRQNTPEALARAAELEQLDLDKRRAETAKAKYEVSPEYLNVLQQKQGLENQLKESQIQANKARADYTNNRLEQLQGVAGALTGRPVTDPATGQTYSMPTRTTMNYLQRASQSISQLEQMLPDIIEGQAQYAEAAGKRQNLYDVIAGQFGASKEGEPNKKFEDRLEKQYKSEALIKTSAELMTKAFGLNGTNHNVELMREILTRGTWETAKGYRSRIKHEMSLLAKRKAMYDEAMKKGIPLTQEQVRMYLPRGNWEFETPQGIANPNNQVMSQEIDNDLGMERVF